MVLAEKRLPYDLIEVDLKNKPKDLLELNPYGKVPVLVDDDAVIYESAIIDEYLEEKFPEPPLMPRDPTARARVRIWVDFCNTRLQAAGSDVAHGNDPEKAKEKVRQHLAILDREMANREYIAGDLARPAVNSTL
ncbi:MAG: glutathione S-transferase family protein [Deltaproteobacteria bacterium]|nr:glutathione S-transferase family protein [Deltaproteobacteria bacterium]